MDGKIVILELLDNGVGNYLRNWKIYFFFLRSNYGIVRGYGLVRIVRSKEFSIGVFGWESFLFFYNFYILKCWKT